MLTCCWGQQELLRVGIRFCWGCVSLTVDWIVSVCACVCLCELGPVAVCLPVNIDLVPMPGLCEPACWGWDVQVSSRVFVSQCAGAGMSVSSSLSGQADVSLTAVFSRLRVCLLVSGRVYEEAQSQGILRRERKQEDRRVGHVGRCPRSLDLPAYFWGVLALPLLHLGVRTVLSPEYPSSLS